ncbi:hypothetical protein KSP40_PGU015610 [Platanthera guangdongensis]|uniref:Uncharacterized protein n=1 Tax=Platanthera guangdongensis TaxID=2320717 RepID=A0ABR2LJG7_9ASPA
MYWKKATVKKETIAAEQTMQEINFFNLSVENQEETKTDAPTVLPNEAPSDFNDEFYVNLSFDFPGIPDVFKP